MSIGFRAILIMISILTLSYILKKIRDAKLEIEHALFWLGFAGIIFILSIFPSCVYWLTDLLEIQSPVNFVFLAISMYLEIHTFSPMIDWMQFLPVVTKQYWFINIEPKYNIILEPLIVVERKTICGCSNQVEKSMINPQYANRFIREFIL